MTFTFWSYLRDRLAALLIGAGALAVMCWVAWVCGLTVDAVALLAAVGIIAGALVLVLGYARRRRFYSELDTLADELPSAWQLSSLVEEPDFLEGRCTHAALEAMGKAAADEVEEGRRQAEEYRRYVELWIHEVKTPIAAAALVASNVPGEEGAAVKRELERIEQQVEQALYYARSTSLANDYVIREVDVAGVCRAACKKNARLLIEQGVSPVFGAFAGCGSPSASDPASVSDPASDLAPDLRSASSSLHPSQDSASSSSASPCADASSGGFAATVFADEKWLAFVIGQVVVNAAKYGARTVRFSAREEDAGTANARTVLEIADDGKGIPAADVPRVFDRGFTGENGRSHGSSTGMGLYLCAVMCERMGLGIAIASEQGVGTRVMIAFPHDRRRLDAVR